MKREIAKDEYARKRALRRRKIRKRRITAFLIFFIILLLCVGAVLSFTVFFPIENISASGSKIYTAEQIIKISGVEKGDNLFAVSKKSTEKQLKKVLPYVDNIEFERTLPDSLNIKVKDAQEFACYKIGKAYYTVSENGWVLKKDTEKNDKLITVLAKGVKCKVGSEITFEDENQKLLVETISQALKGQNINVDIIDVTNNVELSAKVENRFEVNFGTSNDLLEKIRHLSGMIKEIPEGKGGKINLSMWTSDNTRGTFVAEN